jgi:uncharacterized membrane protein (DUF106 family)
MMFIEDRTMDELTEKLLALKEAAYAAIRAGNDTTMLPYLNRQQLHEIARLADEMVKQPMLPESPND